MTGFGKVDGAIADAATPRTNELIERLNRAADYIRVAASGNISHSAACSEAAAEIERLREALIAVELARMSDGPEDWTEATRLTEIALKAALKGQP
tara:strand:- start:124 stop:411 length:288 start_codon:yes stop_codon:yes gene_type:complete